MAVWNDGIYVTVYEMARDGRSLNDIYKMIGSSPNQFKNWLAKKPHLQEALDRGRKFREGAEWFKEYVHGRLSPECREMWDRICLYEKSENGRLRLEELLANCGERMKQRLFLYAMVTGDFTRGKACQKLMISLSTVNSWCKDKGFQQLIDEVQLIQRDYVEGVVMKMVPEDPNIARFVLERIHPEKYGYKMRVEGKVDHHHTHEMVSTADFMDELDENGMVMVLEAMERARNRKLGLVEAKPLMLDVKPIEGKSEELRLDDSNLSSS